jgi:site-specific recombinase XerD
VYGIVRHAFREAADQLDRAGHSGLAAHLRQASTQWLRHTTATQLIRAKRDLTDVQHLLRHRDSNTTSTYYHTTLDEVAAALSDGLTLPK